MNSELESKILCQELGKLAGPIAGIGARWAARRLQNISHEMSAYSEISASELYRIASAILSELGGKDHSNLLTSKALNETLAIVGSGIMEMNPTLFRVTVKEETSGTSLHLRAVAKEGAIPQRSAELAVDKFIAILRLRLPEDSLHSASPS